MRWMAVRAAVFAATLIGWLAVATTPASAYSPNPVANWVRQDAGTCDWIEQFHGGGPIDNFDGWPSGSGGCYLGEPAFTALFPHDANSQNVLVILYEGNTEIGVVTFQASDELLDIYDMTDDSDTFYVWLGGHGPYCACPGGPGVDFAEFNLNLTDGASYSFEITDDQAGNDVIAGTTLVNIPLPFIRP